MNKRTFLAGLVGYIASFLLGWLMYGLLLKEMYESGTMAGINKPESDMIWWALLLGQLAWVILFVYLLEKAGARTFNAGVMMGVIIGLLFAICLDLYFYAGTNMYTNNKLIFVDILHSALQGAILGGIIGWMLGRGMKVPSNIPA